MEVIIPSVRLVMDAATSMRGASRCIRVLLDISERQYDVEPSHTTIQNFLLRIGLYVMQQARRFAEDWIWLVDHTIAGGTTKCLVVLGIRYADYVVLNRPLQHRDLEPIALVPVEKSNGEIVQGQLEGLRQTCGTPLAILSDAGSDLKCGIDRFREKHAEVIPLYDIVHAVSGMMKKLLESDEKWDAFRQACCRCANSIRQSSLAHLKPPRPKTKARYMNIDREISWGSRAMQILQRVRRGDLTERQQQRLPQELIESKLDWLDDYAESIELWQELSRLAQQSCTVVRRYGYGAKALQILESTLGEPTQEKSKQLVEQILAHMKRQCAEMGNHSRLPGSSEVLESLIGKGKRLMGFNNTNSLTAQVLAMATATADITSDCVRAALATCRIKHAQEWMKTNLPHSLQRDRRIDLPSNTKEEKLRKAENLAIPVF